MLDTEWLNDPQEAGHVLAWAREFARKKRAVGQQVWFAGIEEGYRRVRAAWAGAVLAEQLYDDGLAEVRLTGGGMDHQGTQSEDVAVSYNGGDWQHWRVLGLTEPGLKENWLSRIEGLRGGGPATLCLLPEEAREFLLRQKNEYVKGQASEGLHHWGMVLAPGDEFAARLTAGMHTLTEPHHARLSD